MTKRAVVLLSGGLDSATTAFMAKRDIGVRGELYTISFCYGQKHDKELESAYKLSIVLEAEYNEVELVLDDISYSALTGELDIPTEGIGSGIPATWVPQRNATFLTLAAALAEKVGADYIYTGVNAVDYSGYPDCRPEFIEAMNKAINLASKRYVETGRGFSIETPIIRKSKVEIVKLGIDLGVPFDLTWSCYKGSKKACGVCDSCRIRLAAFKEVGLEDPIEYE